MSDTPRQPDSNQPPRIEAPRAGAGTGLSSTHPEGQLATPVRHQATAATGGSARSTPLAARGEPFVWLTGLTLALCIAMIVGLLVLVLVNGLTTFWPEPIAKVTLRDGTVLYGVPVRDEAYVPLPEEIEQIEALPADVREDSEAFNAEGMPIRRLYRVGNKEFRQGPFEWVPLYEIGRVDYPENVAFVERLAWGVWLGEPQSVVVVEEVTLPPGAPAPAEETTEQGPEGPRTVRNEILSESEDGIVVRRTVEVARGPDEAWSALEEVLPEAHRRHERIEHLNKAEGGAVRAQLDRERLRFESAKLEHLRTLRGDRQPLSTPVWTALAALAAVSLASACMVTWRRIRDAGPPGAKKRYESLVPVGLWLAAIAFLLGAWLEAPWSAPNMSAEELARAEARYEQRSAELLERNAEINRRIAELQALDGRERVLIVEPTTGRFAPVRQTEPDEPMMVSQIVRMFPANELSFGEKVGVYFSRWWEFVSDDPRESNSEGGVFPVIFGTVMLTILLSIAVVPLGVIAALYMREYARQGIIISIVRVAVNNLAGVPSIVYGVFGLGFFCLTVGKYIDLGPRGVFADAGPWDPFSRAGWWIGLGALLASIFGAVTIGVFARALPGQHRTRLQEWGAGIAAAMWGAAVLGAAALVATTPYFNGFFEARGDAPTFGTSGLLWASLTLALLTLPVVIVATEEAISAVPRSMREGSYACGASKWQTIRRIVLPRAMPGIMTGMILAMARGAGEVAPLMIVGAVKLADELPISSHAPFVHLERSFMHLGFHIYDLGFQSPDSEAARPLLWTTTFLLISIVLMLNIVAIRVRSRLRKRFVGSAF